MSAHPESITRPIASSSTSVEHWIANIITQGKSMWKNFFLNDNAENDTGFWWKLGSPKKKKKKSQNLESNYQKISFHLCHWHKCLHHYSSFIWICKFWNERGSPLKTKQHSAMQLLTFQLTGWPLEFEMMLIRNSHKLSKLSCQNQFTWDIYTEWV